ncbi:MAG: hypothetical protein RLZZ400_196 [Actinomycetota bacterium]|jgi:hypothetical protein
MPKYPSAIDVKLPVLPGFYPDPSVVLVGDRYYLANSTFEYGPGVPIHSSSDLINWTFESHALQTKAHSDLTGLTDSMGIFAPTLRFHDGKFYMITTLTDGKWQVLVTATNPAGPWSEPVRIDAPGIDPDLAWDEIGNCCMSYASLALGGLAQVQINTETGALVSEPKRIWQGMGGKFPEGPHLYRIGDWWYLLIAEGGTERGHAVALARSKNINGPFEGDPSGVLLSNRGTDLPIQNTGHADLVQRPDGTWAMVFHGTRPRGGSPEWHVMGRETCAVGIDWEDGWPKLGTPIEPSAIAPVSESLDRNSEPPAQWITPGGWAHELIEKTPDGLMVNGYVGRRQTTPIFEVRAKLSGDDLHGLGVGIDSKHHFSLVRTGNKVAAMWAIGSRYFELESVDITGSSFEFCIKAEETVAEGFHRGGPDNLVASLRYANGEVKELARIDGKYISTEVAGGMTGRVIGIIAAGPTLLESWSYEGQ